MFLDALSHLSPLTIGVLVVYKLLIKVEIGSNEESIITPPNVLPLKF
uniref:Uncharacterized protein n=1 Tax=virus sp. ctrcb4 TaxID=2825824 RepID=A0A8S5RPR2_9VIRU|nr:MAG TPA: hypothetical protein [virus sp. ctrcb4]DAR12767.1 MAG TPA: hypothetical protein [Crassvirales sp.]